MPPTYLTPGRSRRRARTGAPLVRLAAAVIVVAVVAAAIATAARAACVLAIHGGGDGHGIGMSQYGAAGYAEHGYGYQAILAHYYQGTALGQTSPTRTVRVLIADGSVASLSGASAVDGVALRPGQTYDVRPVGNGRLQLTSAVGAAAAATGAAAPLLTATAPLTVTGPGPLTVPGHGTYRGTLRFSPDGQGGVLTVNVVGLDDYVRGVVAAEMPASWPAAALDAQAVAARTYAITTEVGASAYDLYDDTRSQVYGGVGAETTATNAAVAATSGQIVTYDGQPAVTYFFASSGGHTESIQNVWPGATPEPWLVGVPDPYDGAARDPYHAWSMSMTLRAAQSRLGGLVRGRLIGIVVTRHGVSPRIVTAQVVGSAGRSTVTGGQLEGAFGLDSTYAAFATVCTGSSAGGLSGSVYPAPAHAPGSVVVQQLTPTGWRTLGRDGLTAGAFHATVPGPGRYRITLGLFSGPAVGTT